MPERVSPEQRNSEPYRWCVYCDADCCVSDPEHAEWCPSLTGVHPVQTEDRCRHCGQAFAVARLTPWACGECGAEFAAGDHYVTVRQGGDEPTVYLAVCIACAARAEEAS